MAALFQGKTKAEWDAEINGWQFEDVWRAIMKRLYPDHLIKNESRGNDTGESLYDKLKPFTKVGDEIVFATKLAYDPTVLNELAQYKTERLHQIDQTFRILNLFNWKQAALNASLFLNVSNRSILIRQIVKNDMETELLAIEAEDALLKSAEDDKQSEFDADKAFMEGLDLKNMTAALRNQAVVILIKDWLKRN